VASEAGASAETVTGVTNDEEAKDESWKSWKSYQKTYIQWKINGKSMENQWQINGKSMANQWKINRI